MKSLLLVFLIVLASASYAGAESTNLVANGSFEQSAGQAGVPDFWSAAGNRAIKQRVLLDTGRNGKPCAKLECTEYSGEGPDYHAMICQNNRVTVRRNQWYRLSFWAKAAGLKEGAVETALNSTRPWENAGLSEAFSPTPDWQRYEFVFQTKRDVSAASSRLQFWFRGTGALWLDEVVLAEYTDGQQWFPQISTAGVKNFVPNSSFECGTANWGSFTFGLSGWIGNLYRLEGQLDTLAQHGQHSLKIALAPESLPVFWFDYYDPVRQPVRRVFAANHGWFRVQPGEKLTLSAFLRADAPNTAAQLLVNEAPARLQRKQVSVGTEWQRYEFTFTPREAFLFIGVGLDLEASQRDRGTLWLDSIQLERGEHATAYEPRHAVESFLEAAPLGNIFTNNAADASLTVRGYNNSDTAQPAAGHLTITDFFDRPVLDQPQAHPLPAHSGDSWTLANAARGQRGFFRAEWVTGVSTQAVRYAVIQPINNKLTDSPLGFNHAYPWDYLVQLAREAGIVWWRDWSAKWQTIEPQKGSLDFSIPDAQIQRVLKQNSQVEVLLPFPSASWSTAAKPEEVERAAGKDTYLRTRLPVAYAPKDLNDFGNFAAQVVRHYRAIQPNGVTHFQILNEPVYTSYALPREFGYTLEDYIHFLAAAHRAMKAADPTCVVVGGISANLNSDYTRNFIAQGGLKYLDVFDMHLYDAPRPAENYDAEFHKLEELNRAQGGPKPMWITEWGCYAEDDPACYPHSVGDASMNRCRWPNERAATEHIVKFTAVSFGHGVRKIFFHAGTGGTINSPNAGGVLFEYGGAPRKMYAGIAALTGMLGVPDACEKIVNTDTLHAYVFRTGKRAVAIAWCGSGKTQTLKLARSVQAADIMGNPLASPNLALTSSPVYLTAPDVNEIVASLTR